MSGIWAVVPVKERDRAKERLAPLLSSSARQALVLAMLEDVLRALTAARGLAGIAVVTCDSEAGRLARGCGARIIEDGARCGHTGAVAAAAGLLETEGCAGMLTLPGDIPLVTSDEIDQIIMAHRAPPAFTIVPSHDDGGSNAILVSPPAAVPLRFGEDSFFPHLRAAEARGIAPTVVRLPGIALDIDNPADIERFLRQPSGTRTRALLDGNAIVTAVRSDPAHR